MGKEIDFDWKKEKLITREELEEKEVYYTNYEIKQINAKNHGIALFISVLYFLGMSTLLIYFWNDQSIQFQENIKSIVFDFNRWSELVNYFTPRLNKKFLGLIIILFFFLTSVHSFIYSLRKSISN